MASEDPRQELEKDPFIPIRLHLSSDKTVDIQDPSTAWIQQNSVLICHRIRPGTQVIGSYEVVAFRLIERIEQIPEANAAA